MRIRLASVFTVVDARGAEMDRSETVTMFNDLCVLAPAALIDRRIIWDAQDELHARATFSNAGQSISAVLSFNERGELVDFSSDDRAMTSDGKSYEHYRWSTPLSDYRQFDGHRLASHGMAIWRIPGADFCYAKLELVALEYNP